MKQVFSSNSQVCHVWANQKQDTGKSKNIFFEGDKIYSYGHHYLMAEIHISKKYRRYALVNSSNYSVSTSGHKRNVYNALNGLMPSFSSPDPSDPKAAVRWLDGQAKGTLNLALKKSKVTSIAEIGHQLRIINDDFEEANHLRSLLGLKEINPNKKQLDKVKKHLNTRLERYKELNTPEMLAKRQAKALKQTARKEESERERLSESIQKFKANGNIDSRLHLLWFELLRIKDNNIVQTSRGAEVPLNDAKRLYMAVKNGLTVVGKTVGNFTVENVFELPNGDFVVKIGCHKILLSEAEQVLK